MLAGLHIVINFPHGAIIIIVTTQLRTAIQQDQAQDTNKILYKHVITSTQAHMYPTQVHTCTYSYIHMQCNYTCSHAFTHIYTYTPIYICNF